MIKNQKIRFVSRFGTGTFLPGNNKGVMVKHSPTQGKEFRAFQRHYSLLFSPFSSTCLAWINFVAGDRIIRRPGAILHIVSG